MFMGKIRHKPISSRSKQRNRLKWSDCSAYGEVGGREPSRPGWLCPHSFSSSSKLCCEHRCASKHCVSAGLARAREKRNICFGRNAKEALGLALPRGKRGGATFFRIRGDRLFRSFKGKHISFCVIHFGAFCCYVLFSYHPIRLIPYSCVHARIFSLCNSLCNTCHHLTRPAHTYSHKTQVYALCILATCFVWCVWTNVFWLAGMAAPLALWAIPRTHVVYACCPARMRHHPCARLAVINAGYHITHSSHCRCAF